MIGDTRLNIFLSSDGQCEWPTQACMGLVMETKVPRKRSEGFFANKAQAAEVHRLIWPGVAVPNLLSSKHARSTACIPAERLFWAKEATMPTSIFMSFLAWGMWSSRRQLPSRTAATMGFSQVCKKLWASIPVCILKHRRLGDGVWVELEVDSTMLVPSSSLWTPDVYTSDLGDLWDGDFTSKPWITTSGQQISLADFVCFALDPKHRGVMRNELQSCAFCLMSQIAALLDTSAQQMASTTAVIGSTLKSNRRKTIPANLIRAVSKEVWEGRASEQHLGSH